MMFQIRLTNDSNILTCNVSYAKEVVFWEAQVGYDGIKHLFAGVGWLTYNIQPPTIQQDDP